jgi:hypothetical protein
MTFVTEVKRKLCTFAVIGLALSAFPALTQAAIIPVLLGSPVPSGSNNAYNYSLRLQQDERLDPAATNGVTCPGPGNTVVQCNPVGTFTTIYDISGFVSASAPANWSVMTQLIGLTPSSVNGSTFDLPNLTNVSFIYNGPVIHSNGVVIPFDGFRIISTLSGTNNGTFSFQATKDVGDAQGQTDQGDGPVTVPGTGGVIQAVPEPGSFLLLGLGMVAIGAVRRFAPKN